MGGPIPVSSIWSFSSASSLAVYDFGSDHVAVLASYVVDDVNLIGILVVVFGFVVEDSVSSRTLLSDSVMPPPVVVPSLVFFTWFGISLSLFSCFCTVKSIGFVFS